MADEWDIVDAAEESSDEENDEYEMREAGEDLLSLGVAVVRSFDEAARKHWNRRLFDAMDDFPEYKLKGRSVQRVLGGFGAFGNPSSFHHPEVRVFRRMRKKLVFRPVMTSYAKLAFPNDRLLLESLFDRLCVRCEAFNRPVAEAWHRDIYGADKHKLRPLPRTLPGNSQDLLFGGWTNLDHRTQSFVGLLATHTSPTSGKAGFAEFSKSEIEKFKFNDRLLKQANRRFGHTVSTDERGYVQVPPGARSSSSNSSSTAWCQESNRTRRRCACSMV